MKKSLLRSKKLRHGSVTVVLTALIVAAVVLLNVIFYALAFRYGLYLDMTSSLAFTVSDDCYDYIDTYVKPQLKDGEKITILFCDEEEYYNSLDTSSVQYYVLKTAKDLAAHYDFIEIKFLNVWIHPSEARKYEITGSTNVSVIRGDKHATFKINEFFTFNSADTTTPIAYNGEKRLAVGMLWVTQPEQKYCYFTVNHGETLFDYELMSICVDAGYTVSTLDLLNFDIPDNCDLLITFNPTQDLTDSDGVSEISEIDKLNAYMESGRNYMIFASADTFVSGSRPNIEQFLEEWGVTYRHEYNEEDEVEYCANIKDITRSVSSDGYTILCDYTTSGYGSEIIASLRDSAFSPIPVFANAACIDIPGKFVSDGNGNYVDAATGRSVSALVTTGSAAEAWAGGRVADRGRFNMMTITKGGTNESGANLLACASVDFAAEESLQSTVYANTYILASAIKAMGKDNVPTKLTFKPFDDTTIDIITTAEMTYITTALALVPLLTAAIAGTVIIVRRKNR